MMLLGALAIIGVIVALFLSAKKRGVEVVSLAPPEAEGPAVPQRLSADKQAVRVAPPPPTASPTGVIAPNVETRRALAAEKRDEAARLYAQQTGLNDAQARNTLDAIMSGSIPVESLVVQAAPRANLDDALQSALRTGNKIEAIKRYREKTGLGLKEAKDAIERMVNGAAPPPLPARAAPVNLDAAIQNAVRAGQKIEAIKLYREKTGLGLKEAKDAIDALFAGGSQPQRTAPPSPAASNVDAAIDAAIRGDQLIQAIKLYREKTGLGLAEAKRAVEARRDQLRR